MKTKSKAEIFKLAIEQARQEEVEWSHLSLTNALKDIVDEKEEEYSEADLKEKWLNKNLLMDCRKCPINSYTKS